MTTVVTEEGEEFLREQARDLIETQEYSVWSWGTNPPHECAPEDASAEALMSDIQYHLGCYYEATQALQQTYSAFGVDKEAPDMPPWWTEEAMSEYARRRDEESNE